MRGLRGRRRRQKTEDRSQKPEDRSQNKTCGFLAQYNEVFSKYSTIALKNNQESIDIT
jgi:hypothetical protein